MTHAVRSPAVCTKAAETLRSLLAGDLDFHEQNSSYASHALHAFAAKFPPQLPRVFVDALTQPGDVVLDPMMGSGTAVLEAALLARRAVGVDIDPLAVRLCRVKTTPVHTGRAVRAMRSVVASAAMLLMHPSSIRSEMHRRFDAPTKRFLDYWFLSSTQQQLMALVMAIEEEQDPVLQRLLRLVFSSVIITKSGGVSLARDLAHSRPHRVLAKVPRDAIEQFEHRCRNAIAGLQALPAHAPPVQISCADARSLPLGNNRVDLVITSPPYANAIDYMRAHKFSLVWFGESVTKLTALRSTYVGAENCRASASDRLPNTALATVQTVSGLDLRKGRVLRKYLGDMKLVLAEIFRVLRPGAAAALVIGPSTMRGVRVETHRLLAELAEQVGFDAVGLAERKLDRDRRMMPARNDKTRMNGIEQRMHSEFVVGLVRP
jgi:DNA modification methylase